METMTDLQVSAYGAQLTSLKVYNFTLVDTGSISSTGSTGGGPQPGAGERIYTLGGMTTQEVPLTLVATTGAFGFAGASPGTMLAIPRFNTTSTSVTGQLVVSWVRAGAATSTSAATPAIGGTATGPITTTTGMLVQLFTLGLYAPAVSSST